MIEALSFPLYTLISLGEALWTPSSSSVLAVMRVGRPVAQPV